MPRTPYRRPAAIAAGLLCLAAAACVRPGAAGPVPPADDDYGPVADFRLTERDGRTVTRADLLGKVWVASFVFTRCTGPCPQVTGTMARLQSELKGEPDVRLVTFTVDPARDDPAELRKYAEHFGADPGRWLFLTGPEEELYRLIRESFRLAVQPNTGPDRRPGNEVMHSTRLVLVDRHGEIRGYFDGVREPELPDADAQFEANLRKLKEKAAALAREGPR
jgi:cytochrome oxidase Cu insertion factor (SCO1/SenC/PrrC family)